MYGLRYMWHSFYTVLLQDVIQQLLNLWSMADLRTRVVQTLWKWYFTLFPVFSDNSLRLWSETNFSVLRLARLSNFVKYWNAANCSRNTWFQSNFNLLTFDSGWCWGPGFRSGRKILKVLVWRNFRKWKRGPLAALLIY